MHDWSHDLGFCHLTGGSAQLGGGGGRSWQGVCPPRGGGLHQGCRPLPPRYRQVAGGAHPTGMHSCYCPYSVVAEGYIFKAFVSTSRGREVTPNASWDRSHGSQGEVVWPWVAGDIPSPLDSTPSRQHLPRTAPPSWTAPPPIRELRSMHSYFIDYFVFRWVSMGLYSGLSGHQCHQLILPLQLLSGNANNLVLP